MGFERKYDGMEMQVQECDMNRRWNMTATNKERLWCPVLYCRADNYRYACMERYVGQIGSSRSKVQATTVVRTRLRLLWRTYWERADMCE